MLKVYLGGYMPTGDRSDWRECFTAKLRTRFEACGSRGLFNVHDYLELLEPHANIEHYAMRDLRLLRQADVMVAYITPEVNKGVGVSWEMGWCFARGIPVIMVTERRGEVDYASWGLNEQFASCIVPSLDAAAQVLFQMR